MTVEERTFAGATATSSRYRAQASWGEVPLAESDRAVRVDVPGEVPTLWFPWADVRAERLTPGGTEAWGGGEVERFDAHGPAPERVGPVGWHDATTAPSDGVGVVRRWLRPPPGIEALADHAVVDHERATVELLDGVEGDDPRDVTVKRFPNWGDGSDLVAILDRGVVVHDARRPVVEGSQMLGQCIVAAMRGSPGRRVVSGHLAFLRAADANQPLAIELDALADGRTFTTVSPRVLQGERLCAAGTLLLGVPGADVVRHAESSGPVAGPYDSPPYDMGVTGRDIRVVDGAYTDDPDAPVGPPVIDAWVRFREVPDDPALHAGLLAQFTGHMSHAAALRPHAGIGQVEAHRTISTAINAIAISLHAEVRMDHWVRYRHLATVVRDGMAHSECRVYDEAGALLASFTVDGMLRPLDRPSPDARTVL